MYVLVAGGGKVGYYLIKNLLERGHEVALVERDAAICQRIANELDIVVINGDASDVSILEDAEAGRADVLAAVAGHDEENLVICQIGKRNFSVKRTVARVNNPKNERIFKALGVDSAISGTSLLTRTIEQEIDREDLRTLLTFRHGLMALVEVVLPETAPVVGREVKDLRLPDDCVLVCLIRNEEIIFPHGDTALMAGDTVIAVTRHGKDRELEQALVGHAHHGSR